MQRRRLRDHLAGPPPALPALLDRASERWASATPRLRVLAIAVLVALFALGGLVRVTASPYGPPTTVLVAARDLAVGERPDAADLQARRWPSDLLPAGAFASFADLGAETTVIAPLPAGAVATSRHLGGLGIAELLDGEVVGVPVPAESVPEVEPGTRVDLVGRDAYGDPVRLGSRALLVTDDGVTVWLAVAPSEAAGVAAAAAVGTLTLVVHPG